MGGLLTVNIMVIAGVLLNRMNIAVFGMYGYGKSMGGSYFPSIMEFVITLAIIAAGILLFKLVAKYLTLFPETEAEYSR